MFNEFNAEKDISFAFACEHFMANTQLQKVLYFFTKNAINLTKRIMHKNQFESC